MPKVKLLWISVFLLLFMACNSTAQEARGADWKRASVLDLRYKSREFDESMVLVTGYLPEAKAGNFIWLYATPGAAIHNDRGFGISLVAASDELREIKDNCGSGYAHIQGVFVADNSPSGGVIAVERVTMIDEDESGNFSPCWVVE